jgi:hypothetical protein
MEKEKAPNIRPKDKEPFWLLLFPEASLPSWIPKVLFFFFFFGAGDRTQGLALARQALFHLRFLRTDHWPLSSSFLNFKPYCPRGAH